MRNESLITAKVLVILEKSDGGYWATVKDLPGCYSFGETPERALANTKEAITEHISDLEETGEKIPEIFKTNYEILIQYDLQTLFEAFNFINKTAFAAFAGINPSLLRQYSKGIAFASDKQKAKINDALCSISRNLENACI